MKNSTNQKLRLLYMLDILLHKSDEKHPLTSSDIIELLDKNYGIACERKTVYDCIDSLNEYGYKIVKSSSPRGYYMASRTFKPSELRLLIDAVQSASFISVKKSKELIEKLCSFASDYQNKRINKQVYIDNRNKCNNENLLVNIDLLNTAVLTHRQVKITYRRRKVTENRIEYDEKEMIINPYALLWANDHYYLVGNYSKYDNLLHLRVDRISSVFITEDFYRPFSEVSPYRSFFDTADYSGKHLSMFSGEIKPVDLICKNEIVEEFIDKFGEACPMRVYDKDSFRAEISVAVNDGLVSWIMQYGNKIKVAGPKVLKAMLIERAEAVLSVYDRKK